MTLLALATIAAMVGYLARTSWIVALPAVAAVLIAIAIGLAGGSLGDSPIAFATATATISVVLGRIAHRYRLYEVP